MKKYEIKLDRRNFLKKSTMVGLASIAPGVFFQEFAQNSQKICLKPGPPAVFISAILVTFHVANRHSKDSQIAAQWGPNSSQVGPNMSWRKSFVLCFSAREPILIDTDMF